MKDRSEQRIEHHTTLRERTFTFLAKAWAEAVEREEEPADWVVTSQYMRNLNGACLLLAAEHGGDFGPEALNAASYNEKLATTARNLDWLIGVPWRICVRSITNEVQFTNIFHEVIYPGLEHPNSLYRGLVISTAWLIKGLLDRDVVTEAMLRNFAKTLNFVEESWALAVRLYPYEEEEFYAIADKWNPASLSEKLNGSQSPFLDQYKKRTKLIKELGIAKASATLTEYERDCYETLASTALFINEPIE